MRAFITASFHPAAKARLERHMEVAHEDWRVRQAIYFDGSKFAERIRLLGADVLIVEADLVHAEVLESCPLRMIGCCRGDPVNIDLDLATRKGIPVFHTPGRNADAVADLTLAFMLMLARHLPQVAETFQGGGPAFERTGDFLEMYNRFTGVELGGQTVGLVALGAVGREVAARLRAFKARVLAYDPYVRQPPEGVELTGLEELLRASDFVDAAENRIVRIGDHEMLSVGWSNHTPWDTPRECSEEELEARIDALAAQIEDMETAIFNIHVPPYGTGLDDAPELDENLKPVQGGKVMKPVGSTAVRDAILEHQPLLALHGHIHESRGIQKLGRTTCINPGSVYGEGTLQGVIVELAPEEVRYSLTSG